MNVPEPTETARGYQAIADALRDQIRGGVYSPGSLLPTERELQQTFSVSRSTVRRALAALEESGWAEVLPKRGVAAKMGAAMEMSGNLAYIDHADLVNERLYFALSRMLQGTDFNLIHVDSRRFGVEGAIEYAAEKGFVGAYVWSKEGFPDTERVRAAQRRLPIVSLDHALGGVQTDLVTEDNQGGAREVVRHLAKQGRQRIAISGMMDMLEINHERFSGYLQGLFDAGLTPSPRDIVYCMTSGREEADTSLLARRLADPDRPDAVFVLQDMLVPPVVEAIFAAGLRIPEDITVAAFGGEIPIAIDDVALTTVAIDWERFAEECVRVMQDRLRAPLLPFRETVLPVTLSVRGSCGAPRETWDVEATEGARRRTLQGVLQLRSDDARPVTETGV